MSADPNLDHEAVKMYRDTFLLCPNFGRRKDIVETVKDAELWKSVLTEWKEQKWNPLKVNWMLSDYERREKSTERSVNTSQQRSERERSPEDMQTRISQRREGNLSRLPEGEGIRFRASSETLEQVVTKALRQNYRS